MTRHRGNLLTRRYPPEEVVTISGPDETLFAVRPAQLPPDVADFTGRDEQLVQLLELLQPGSPDQAVVITALAGMAGVGKTALAVHAAHRLRERYPDGQLYVDLRGADRVPLDASGVLARMLRTLGVARTPETLEERTELFRSRLADREVLLLLDNAVTEQQVRPLLPGSPTCGVIVTSRNHLAGLAGVRLIDLDVFEPDQAVELLARIVGARRVAAEPEVAERLVRLCGYLPLAVRIAGGRLAAKPHWALIRLAERVDDEQRRLDELRLGDMEVRAGVTLSYEALDPAAQRALRLLGLLDVPHFEAWVAAAVLGTTPASPARWFRLVTITPQVGLPGSSGRTCCSVTALSSSNSTARSASRLRNSSVRSSSVSGVRATPSVRSIRASTPAASSGTWSAPRRST